MERTRGLGRGEGLFGLCREVPASEAARKAGLPLKLSGSRLWTACPFHRERTPSLCFFPDGGFKCFGCGAAGDAVTFYARLYSLPAKEAAARLAGDFGLAPPAFGKAPPPLVNRGREVMRAAEAWKARQWSRLCDTKHRAAHMLALAEERAGSPEKCWESEAFVAALAARDAAEMGLHLLTEASPRQLLSWAAEGGE